jgi:hypothetical protein
MLMNIVCLLCFWTMLLDIVFFFFGYIDGYSLFSLFLVMLIDIVYLVCFWLC